MSDLQIFMMLFSMLAFSWGACVGSFLNVCIYRIPLDLSVVTPRSHCPSCKKQIAWYHNIPIFTYLTLRGKCAYCGEKITPRYFLVEMLVAVLFLLVWFKFQIVAGYIPPLGMEVFTNPFLILIYWLVISGLVLGTFVDFEHMIIPDRVTLGGIAAGLMLSIAVPALHGKETILASLISSIIGLVVGWGSLWLVAVIGKAIFKKDAMGFGDVKLLGAIGAFFGWEAVLFVIMVSSFVGAFVGIALIMAKKKELQGRIPFGPYLSLAALIWMLWGERLWAMYTSLLMVSSI